MIDSERLAQVFLDETRRHQEHHTFQNEPDLSVQEKWDRQVSEHPLPAALELATVIEEIFWATMLREEGRPCRPRLRYLPEREPDRTAHWLANPEPLNRQTLRKLVPAQGPENCLLWSCADGKPVIIGIDTQNTMDLTIDGSDVGAISISWNMFRYLSFRGGEARWLSECALPDSSTLSPVLAEVLGTITASLFLPQMSRVAELGHGGAFWFVRDPQKLSGVSIGVPLRDDQLPLMDRFDHPSKFERREPWLSSIATLGGADGAVLLDAQGRVLGFGTFIDTPSPVPVLLRLPDGQQRTISSFELGGGRHRSAVQFCQACGPAAAFVASADGRVVVFVSPGGGTVWCGEHNTVGFSMF